MRKLLPLLVLLVILGGCEDDYTPKPIAYARIDLPPHDYLGPKMDSWHCPYVFEASRQAYITVDPRHQKEPCWYNVFYPKFDATIHLTYSEVDGNLPTYIEDSRTLAMKHIGKATRINERVIENDSARVYGIAYEFQGETASDMQFFVTDSTQHFLRGSLYFNVRPNKDSLAPVITYIKEDIEHMIQSLRWIDTATPSSPLKGGSVKQPDSGK